MGRWIEVTEGGTDWLLAELGEIHQRTAAYRVICGDAVIAPTVTEIASLRETLTALTNDASVRFAMLELDVPVDEAPTTTPAPTAAERAADAALAARRAELEARQVELLAERGLQLDDAGEIVPLVPQQPAPMVRRPGGLPSNAEIAARRAAAQAQPAAAVVELSDSSARFALLELD